MSFLTTFPENPDVLRCDWLSAEGTGVPGGKAAKLTVSRQCELLGVSRTGIYRKPAGKDTEREELIKARIDYWHTKMPYLGVRKLRNKLREDDKERKGDGEEPMKAGRKLIAKYMKEMGIYAVYPKPNLSLRNKEHKVFPYLLRDFAHRFPNQVWALDITYIKMSHGHMYLTAIIDWYSRYIVGWALSDTLDTAPVLDAVKDAIFRHGVPALINSDQGPQFTSEEYTSYLKDMRIRQSMDGKARWIDNVVIERWFRSFKTEWLYVTEITSPRDLRAGITEYVREYNEDRPHQAHDYRTPKAVYETPFAEAA
jgi:putative transposase